MLDEAIVLPDDPEDLRVLSTRPVVEAKARAILVEKLPRQFTDLHARGHSGPDADGQLDDPGRKVERRWLQPGTPAC